MNRRYGVGTVVATLGVLSGNEAPGAYRHLFPYSVKT